MTPEVKFGFGFRALNAETGEDIVQVALQGEYVAHGVISMKPKGPDSVGYVMVLGHEMPGQFNVLAYSETNGNKNFSLTHIEDATRLLEHMRELGVSDKLIKQWNDMAAASPMAIQELPVAVGNVEKQAISAIAQVMGKRSPGAAHE